MRPPGSENLLRSSGPKKGAKKADTLLTGRGHCGSIYAVDCGHRAVSFNHLVGATDQGHRDFQSKCLGSLQIYDQFDLCGLLDRQISRLFATEYSADVRSDSA